jgi:hypothetical protein
MPQGIILPRLVKEYIDEAGKTILSEGAKFEIKSNGTTEFPNGQQFNWSKIGSFEYNKLYHCIGIKLSGGAGKKVFVTLPARKKAMKKVSQAMKR